MWCASSLLDGQKVYHHEEHSVATPQPNRSDSRKGAKGAKVPQIPLFPPLSKGDERGFLDFFASLASWRDQNNQGFRLRKFAQTKKTFNHSITKVTKFLSPRPKTQITHLLIC
jgi:hypothetical protein